MHGIGPVQGPTAGSGGARADRTVVQDLVRDALESRRPTQALALLSLFRARGPADAEASCCQALALQAQGRLREAAMVAAQGLECAPRSAALLYLVAGCEGRLGNAAGAARALRAALELLPDEPILRCRRADHLLREGRRSEAGREYELARELARPLSANDPAFQLVRLCNPAIGRAPLGSAEAAAAFEVPALVFALLEADRREVGRSGAGRAAEPAGAGAGRLLALAALAVLAWALLSALP
jgi:tetratricopeptide (TPR) repeat protein